MELSTPLFEGELIYLAPVDHDKDPAVMAAWTEEATYLRLLDPEPARPLSAEQLKKQHSAIEKRIEEGKNEFYYTIRLRADDRLVGFVRLYWISWTSGTAHLQIGIGDPQSRRQGYGREALDLMVRYAFDELNLHRLAAEVPEYNPAAYRLFERAGFVVEVRRRQALHRDGRRWDSLYLGLLRREWEADLRPYPDQESRLDGMERSGDR